MQEMAFLRAQIFKIFRGNIPPDPPRSFSIQYLFCSHCFVVNRQHLAQSRLFIAVVLRRFFRLASEAQFANSSFRVQPYFLRARDSETLIGGAEISRLV